MSAEISTYAATTWLNTYPGWAIIRDNVLRRGGPSARRARGDRFYYLSRARARMRVNYRKDRYYAGGRRKLDCCARRDVTRSRSRVDLDPTGDNDDVVDVGDAGQFEKVENARAQVYTYSRALFTSSLS